MSKRAMPVRALMFIVAVGLVLVAASCGNQAAHKLGASGTIRFGFDSQTLSSGDVATRLAIGRYAQANGKRLVSLPLGSPQNVVTALVHGDIEMGSLRLPDLIKAVGAGARVQGIAILQRQREFVLAALPSIHTSRDLSGHSVAENGPGTDSETLAKVAIKGAGLSPTSVRLIAIPHGPARATALLRGTVQAAGLRYADYLRIRAHRPGLHIVASMPVLLPDTVSQTLVVSDEFASANGPRLHSLVRDITAEYRQLYGPGGENLFVADARRDILASDPRAVAIGTYDFYKSIHEWPTAHIELTAPELRALERAYIGSGQLSTAEPFARVWDPRFG